MSATKPQPIIVIKKKGGHGGHHGGAWKVAYADFVTAMMSLFIVLWLMSSSEQVKKAVAGYFNDPRGSGKMLGTTVSGNGVPTAANQDNMKALKEKLEAEIQQKKELQKLSKQIEITITAEGLRIELLEGKGATFYQVGSPNLSTDGKELLGLLGGELKTLPNSLLIEGHTDSTPYSSDTGYSNWELSADRANAARRILQQDGVRLNQVTQIRGYADQMLRIQGKPLDPGNRRISILVKNQEGVAAAVKQGQAVGKETSSAGPPAQSGSPKGAVPSPAAGQAAKPAASQGKH